MDLAQARAGAIRVSGIFKTEARGGSAQKVHAVVTEPRAVASGINTQRAVTPLPDCSLLLRNVALLHSYPFFSLRQSLKGKLVGGFLMLRIFPPGPLLIGGVTRTSIPSAGCEGFESLIPLSRGGRLVAFK